HREQAREQELSESMRRPQGQRMFANQTRSDRWKLSRQQIGQWLPAFALAILFVAVPGALAQQQPAQSQPAAPPAQTTAPTPVPANQQAESEAPQTLHLLVGR